MVYNLDLTTNARMQKSSTEKRVSTHERLLFPTCVGS